MQQLQLNLDSDEQIALDLVVEQQLVDLMAEMMLAVMRWGKETSDGRRSS